MFHGQSRDYAGAQDLENIIDLLLTARTNTQLERYPTAWRLRLVVDTRVWEPARDARLWEDAGGRLVGFACLPRRTEESFSSGLEWLLHPDMQGSGLLETMLTWALDRVHERATVLQSLTASLSVAVSAFDVEKLALLERRGFSLLPDIHNWYMARVLNGSLPAYQLPTGWCIRRVRGDVEHELQAYEALYDFTPLSRSCRQALLGSPDYCHLVIAAPDGTFVAYCEVSINREEWVRHGRRVGWIDYIGTGERFQRKGLGTAMVLAGLQQLEAWGAEMAFLVTMSTNKAAQKTFVAAGFQYNERDFCYTKTIL